jgi:hypothetical protein
MNARRVVSLMGLMLALSSFAGQAATTKPAASATKSTTPGSSQGSSKSGDAKASEVEGQPELFLTWKAPPGMPGATDHLSGSCADTARIDTLFLSFRTGRNRPGLAAISAILLFSPADGDSLGPFWHFKRGWENEGNLLIDFDRVAIMTGSSPWEEMGYGTVSYDHRSGRGRLDLEFRVSADVPLPLLGDEPYVFARVRIRHRHAELAGCSQPVCVELSSAQLKFVTGRQIDVNVGNRMVAWNSPDGAVCKSRKTATAIKPWKPKL